MGFELCPEAGLILNCPVTGEGGSGTDKMNYGQQSVESATPHWKLGLLQDDVFWPNRVLCPLMPVWWVGKKKA